MSETPVKPVRTATVNEYNWMQPTRAAIQLSKSVEDGNEFYTVHIVLWSDINENKEFPLFIATELGDECMRCAAKMGLQFAMSLTSHVALAIIVMDDDANLVEELNADEIAQHEDDEEDEFFVANITPATYLH